VEEEALTPVERGREAMLMGLRLSEGIDPARIARRSGLDFDAVVDRAMLDALMEEGYLRWLPDGRLQATMEGRLRLDAILPVLLR
jgi:coproporphyrinogen III oxidase-like Fe-S oxidoreductase